MLSTFFCFISFTIILWGIFTQKKKKKKNENMILPNGLNFGGVKYPNALKIICCSTWWNKKDINTFDWIKHVI